MTDYALPTGVERRVISDRAAWLQWRLADVTASQVASLFGIGFDTLLRVWAEKAGVITGGGDSPTLRRGRWGEAAVVEMLGDERPRWAVRRSKSLSARCRNPSRRHARCSSD